MSRLIAPRRFILSNYMAPGDAFHLAHKPLAQTGHAPLHIHDYFEVFIVETGVCRHEVNGLTEDLEPGTLAFVRPHDAHALSTAGRELCRIVNVMLRPDCITHLGQRYAEDLSGQFFWAKRENPVTLSLPPERMGEVMALVHRLQTGPRSLARIEAFLLVLMTELTDPTARVASAMPHWLAQACDAARRPEVYRRGAAGLVEAAGRGHEHVCRQMKRHLGLTPSAYVNRLRMDRAATLLTAGDLPLAAVAADVGLENLSHFHRLFRAHHGLTPRAFCARHRAAPF
ncbi:MAG: AraC family transcriptional regulator [Pseudomonadota bacterium]